MLSALDFDRAEPRRSTQLMPIVLTIERNGRAEQYAVMRNIAIGRAPENDIAIPGPEASRHHARIEVGGSGCRLIDLDSANGTFLNGKRLDPRAPATLVGGDTVGLGGITIQVTDTAPPNPHRLIVRTVGGAQTYPLAGEVVSIGRSSANEIPIDHEVVSTRHALVMRTSSGYRIEDRGSTNGVWIRGHQLRYHDLEDGDVIQLGEGVSLEYRSRPG